jgi:protein TonB
MAGIDTDPALRPARSVAVRPAAPFNGADLERRSSRKLALGVALAVLVGLLLLGLMIKSLSGKSTAPRRQVARIALLPDTPPPPPPPKPDKPPEPREAPKPMPREDPARPPDAPQSADAPLKMEGPTGNGPSAFAGGAVTQDYKGGSVVSAAAAGTGTLADRAQERFYANTARQLLRDELDKRLTGDASTLVANFSLWIAADGAIRRFALQPSGNERADADLRLALDAAVLNLRLPAPPAMAQPLRFRLTLRPAG